MEVAVQQASQQQADGEPQSLPCWPPAAPRSRLAFSWGAGALIRVAEVASPATGQGGVDPHAASCAWGDTPIEQRRIAYDIMPLYRQLRTQLHRLGPGRQAEAGEALRAYSSGVLSILTTDASDPAAGPPASPAALQVAYEAGLWALLELFFLSSDAPEGFFAEAFAGWLAAHSGLLCSTPGFNELQAEARRLAGVARVDSEPAYWPTLQHLVLTGQLEAAVGLLTAHPAYQALADPDMASKVEALEAVFQLLRVVPRFSRAGGSSSGRVGGTGTLLNDPVAFAAERAAWLRRAEELWDGREQLLADLKQLDPAASKGLAGVLCLLCAGSDNQATAATALKFMASLAANWVELLAGTLLWKYTSLQPQLHLKQLVARLVHTPGLASRGSDVDFLAFLEQLLLAACDQEVQSIISLCTNAEYCSLQFITHVYDLLRGLPGAERVIARPLPHLGCDQAEAYTLHYVETLMGSAATWQLAAEYLAWCPVYGAGAMEALLDRSPFPLQDSQSALKALALAQRHGLTASAQGLCQRLAMAAVQSGQLGAALQWALRAHDPALAAELVAPLLAKVQQQLLAQAGCTQAAPLDLPELRDMEPLLLALPDQLLQQLSEPDAWASSAAAAACGAAHARVRPYQELHFLHALLRLEDALEQVQRCDQCDGGGGAAGSSRPGPAAAALGAAYEAARAPALQLLLDGLAPAQLRLPLLHHVLPLLESVQSPFSREDVQGLLRVLTAAAGDAPGSPAPVAAALLSGTLACGGGLASEAGLPGAAVASVRLALCRSLARAHATECGLRAGLA